ncbi:hypothetical protein JTE90_026371 [Oedothorax gibbosus]|uniref:RAP domain-containing protein n=1 Tax=Oedothorax gibbosus TaxID=931172 RepID=A0AAV6VFI6_9ARAC|nr:hypothetical protein JTE90_026371 [Oedothorax gibbosus]
MKLARMCLNLYSKSRYTYSLCKSIISSQQSILRPFRNCPALVVCSTRFLGFHTTAITNAKSHQERENEYAHGVLENIRTYKDTLVKLDIASKKLSPPPSSSKELSEFAEVTYKALPQMLNLENEQFDALISKISCALPHVSDDDLVLFLHYLCLWAPSPKSFSPNFKLLWNTLDFQCVERFDSWDMNRKLRVADYWFCLRLNRITKYNSALILSLLQNLDYLSDSNVVQLMFLVNLQRKVPQKYMMPLEEKLLPIIKSATIEEIGVICLGFFKTENKISDMNIIQAIITRYYREVKTMKPLTVNAILKFFKKSLIKSNIFCYTPLLERSVSCVQDWDVPTSIHLALLSTECHVYDPVLLNTVTRKVADNIGEARLKDCVKLLQCLAHFNHVPEQKFNDNFLLELKKEQRYVEIEKYPRVLAYAALYYAYLGHYNYQILSTVLKPDFVDFCVSEFDETENSFVEIDYCIEIECKDYKGPRMPSESLSILSKRRGNLSNGSKKDNTLMGSMNNTLKTLKDLLGSDENILVRHILPHCYSPDVIVRLSTGKTESMSSLYGSFPSELILKPPQDETWAVFVFSSPFSFAYKSRHLIGMSSMKLRQLEKLGYKTFFMHFQDLPLSDLFRKKYLKDVLDSLQMPNSSKKSSVKL